MDFGATRSDGNAVYARRESQVFTVAGSIVEDLSREAEAFREPRLVRFDRSAVDAAGRSVRERQLLPRSKGRWLEPGWPAAARAASVDDLLTAILDIKSKAFADDATGKAARVPPARGDRDGQALRRATPGPVKLYPGGTEARATVSGRPGAFLVAGEPVAPLEAAFQKAAAPAPPPSPTAAISPTIRPPRSRRSSGGVGSV